VGKGAISVVAGYWPLNVQRYRQVPSLSLDDGLAARPARWRAAHPALVVGSEVVDYGRLAQEVGASAQALRGALGETKDRVALVVSSARDLLPLFLGAVRARAVPLLTNAGADAADLSLQLAGFRPDLIVVDEAREAELAAASQGRWRVTSLSALVQAAAAPPRDRRLDLTAPAVGLAGTGQELVYHSNSSLMAWAVSWSAFLPLTEGDVFLTLEPLHRWPGLMVTAASLFQGATSVVVEARSRADITQQLEEHRPDYVIMSFSDAWSYALAADEDLRRAFGRTVQGAFVAIEGRFDVRQRRKIESILGVPVLTVFGMPATGPVLSAHPSWYLDEAVGLPITNVDVWPLSPGTSQALAVPWEAIDYGEIGVRSPLIGVDGRIGDGLHGAQRADGWYPLGAIGLMDPAGLFYLYPWR
jgi:acyl-CoA synthetase (AMP-forming)/AMP-acid ligase II